LVYCIPNLLCGDVQISKTYKYSGLKKGDKVTVTLTINNRKPLRYVHMNDKRAAAFEPVDGSSKYMYEGDLRYYRSVRDEGIDWFADFIPAGEHIIQYELLVAHEGEFSCGPASIECMYRPDIQASSEAMIIKTN
jgi:alpha-2-macroglobulin